MLNYLQGNIARSRKVRNKKVTKHYWTHNIVKQLTLSAGDDIADMFLCSFVQCVQKLVKVILRLATEHRQQLLVLSERYHFTVNGITLFSAENLGLIKFTDKSWMLGIKSVHKEHVILTDGSRVNKPFFEIWTEMYYC